MGKHLENMRKKRLEYEEKQLEAIKKNVDEIKLKDNGTDIDEVFRRLKEKDIHINFKLKEWGSKLEPHFYNIFSWNYNKIMLVLFYNKKRKTQNLKHKTFIKKEWTK